jgi:demethylmenaquinone methyltransferase/2-methoxy-6-polyprenyl-1,4-benzoquinol methylase
MATDFRAEKKRPFAPGEPRGEKVNQLFTAVAPRYDLINDLQSFGLHRQWKRRVIDLARPRPGEHALDVCCGTGDLAVALARRGVETVGLDFNEHMLHLAEVRKSKAEYRSLGSDSSSDHCQTAASKLRFVRGDAKQLPFPQDSFDIVTVGYGLRNLASWETGLLEMHRVSRPGGRLLVLDFGKPENRLWRGLYFGYLRLIVPLLGLLVSGQPGAYAYILESLQRYPAQRGVEKKMRELGLVNVQTIHLLGGAMSINYGAKPVARG